ncbi:MAG: four helix bundle protein [Breznakibacter sp.]
MEECVLKKKRFIFALGSVKLYKDLGDEKKEYILSKQVLRSGTSVVALVQKSEYAK